MKILVTGAGGFIGSHIVDKYLQQGHQVIGLDKNLSFQSVRSNYTQIQADLKSIDRDTLVKLLKDVDVINHHAAQVDVRVSIDNPCEDAWVNIGMTIKLLECAVKANVRRFIFASSAGAIDQGNPSSPYGIAKMSAEHYLRFFRNHHGLQVVTLRYSNVYGPRQSGGVISIFAKNMLKDQLVKINGGKQTRDFVFVKDVAEANQIALKCNPGQYNISTGTSFSIEEVANLISALSDSNSKIQYLPEIKGEVVNSFVYPDHPEGWKAQTLLGEGLKQTIEYFKTR